MSGQQRLATMTVEEFEAHFRKVVREEFREAGLRVDEPLHQDESREDFRFLRKLRKTVDGAASKVGITVLMAVISGMVWLFWQGAQTLWGAK